MKAATAALGLGLAGYCMVLIISKDAIIEMILLLGAGSIALISGSMFTLWKPESYEK